MDDLDLMLLLFYCRETKKNSIISHSRYQKKFLKTLGLLQRRLRQRHIPRVSLQGASRSAWKTLLNSGNDQALITLTGCSFKVFNWLLPKFCELYDTHSPFGAPDGSIFTIQNDLAINQGEQPRMMKGADCLGMCLAWTRTRGSSMVLQIIFGMTATMVSLYLRFGRRILVEVLKSEPLAAIRVPNIDDINTYQAAIRRKHPALKGIWCCMDGLRLCLQQAAGDATTQNNFYNGWTHDHYVTSVFVFCPDGTTQICCYNVPGSIHDSKVAEWGDVFPKLSRVFNSAGGKCVVHSAFSLKNYPYLVKSSQQDPAANNVSNFTRGVRLNREATAMHQSAEWGMRAIQPSFPRLKDRFVCEEFGERKIILKMMILLYNVRATLVGINQIINTYMPALNVNTNATYVV
jgi:hypothetical protein